MNELDFADAIIEEAEIDFEPFYFCVRQVWLIILNRYSLHIQLYFYVLSYPIYIH